MAHDDGHNDIRRLWRDQPSEEVQMSVREIRARAERLERTVRWRNLREYAAAAIVIPVFAVQAWFAETAAVALGCWLVALAALWVVYHLHRRGTARRPAGEQGATSCLEFHRSEIVRQRDLLRSVWWWYLLPFVPGMLLIIVGRALEQPDRLAAALGAAMFLAVIFVAIGRLNQRVARKLQRRLEELDALR
jgi:hypothetical protein